MKNIGNLMKQAQELQSKMATMQEQLGDLSIAGQSGGGLVTVTLSGKGDLKNVEIDSSLMVADEKESWKT